jgi:hypothetical protein
MIRLKITYVCDICELQTEDSYIFTDLNIVQIVKKKIPTGWIEKRDRETGEISLVCNRHKKT